LNAHIIHYRHCPGCNSTSIRPGLSVADHSVSKERFVIWACSSCSLQFTQDVPDQETIGRYYQSAGYISHTNTKAGLINRLYHLVRNITLRQKKDLIIKQTGLKTGNLLDIGSGAGTFAAYMQNSGWSVTGLEPDEDTRIRAQKDYGIKLKPSAELFQLVSQTFNVITLWHVLEHVQHLHRYLDEIKRLIKPGGVVIIAVPNHTSFDAVKYKEYWAAYDVPIHLYHFSPASMRTVLGLHGLKLKEMRPMWFDSFYVSMLSEKYKTGKQRPLNGFLTGLVSNLKAVKDKTKCSSLIYIAEA